VTHWLDRQVSISKAEGLRIHRRIVRKLPMVGQAAARLGEPVALMIETVTVRGKPYAWINHVVWARTLSSNERWTRVSTLLMAKTARKYLTAARAVGWSVEFRKRSMSDEQPDQPMPEDEA
jgi:hypothetical protein